jgi:hypothetical protein
MKGLQTGVNKVQFVDDSMSLLVQCCGISIVLVHVAPEEIDGGYDVRTSFTWNYIHTK